MKNLNEELKTLCMENFKYYKTKYNKTFKNMLNYSLMDANNMIGGLTRYVSKGEDRWLLTTIFTDCNKDFRGIPEIVIMRYAEYFPPTIIELVETRLADWGIPYKQYLEEVK